MRKMIFELGLISEERGYRIEDEIEAMEVVAESGAKGNQVAQLLYRGAL